MIVLSTPPMATATMNIVNTDEATITVARESLIVGEAGQTVAVTALNYYGQPDVTELSTATNDLECVDPTVSEIMLDASGAASVPVAAATQGSASLLSAPRPARLAQTANPLFEFRLMESRPLLEINHRFQLTGAWQLPRRTSSPSRPLTAR